MRTRFRVLIVNLFDRSPFLSPESAKPSLLKVREASEGDSLEKMPPFTRRKIQEVGYGVGHGWAAVHQAVAKRMLVCLDNSEMLKVKTRELESHVLAPNEPIVDMVHSVTQARGTGQKRLFRAFNWQGAKGSVVASLARWEERQRMLIILEQKCQELC